MDRATLGGTTLADAHGMLDCIASLEIIPQSDVRRVEGMLEDLNIVCKHCAEAINELGKKIANGEIENDLLEKLAEDEGEDGENGDEVTEDGYRIHDTSEEDFAEWLKGHLGKDD
jgi:hypothetical protein